MWNSLIHPSVPVLELVIRAVLVYGSILFLLRVSGKRQLGQLSPIEFVTILLISNAVQNAMNGGDNSLSGGLILAVVLVVLSLGIAVLSFKSKPFRRWVEGVPTVLVRHGEVISANLDRELLTRDELAALLRRQGIHQIHLVDLAILESDGTLSVTVKHG